MSEDESLSTGDPQDDNDIIMDEFCMLERFEKLRDQTARNRTSIAELEMKLEDLFVKVKDKTSSRDSRAIARGAACMATWLEIAGRKQPPSLRVAKVSSPGAPPSGPSGETEEEVKIKEEAKEKARAKTKAKEKERRDRKDSMKGFHEMEDQSSEQESYVQEWCEDQNVWYEDGRPGGTEWHEGQWDVHDSNSTSWETPNEWMSTASSSQQTAPNTGGSIQMLGGLDLCAVEKWDWNTRKPINARTDQSNRTITFGVDTAACRTVVPRDQPAARGYRALGSRSWSASFHNWKIRGLG